MNNPLRAGEQVGHFLWVLLHGFAGSGLLHPLTGLDHMMAMIAVGAWSAQLGGKNIIRVPLGFVTVMCIGGVLGVHSAALPFVETGIVFSVILLGLAIAANRRMAAPLAALAVGIFGLCHGYAHGREWPHLQQPSLYITGFLVTTATLHVVGAVGGLLLLERKDGARALRRAGVFVFLVGVYLLVRP